MNFTRTALSIALLVSAISLNAMESAASTASTATTTSTATAEATQGRLSRAYSWAKDYVVAGKDRAVGAGSAVVGALKPYPVLHEIPAKDGVAANSVETQVSGLVDGRKDALKDARFAGARVAAYKFTLNHPYIANAMKYTTLAALVGTVGRAVYNRLTSKVAEALVEDEVGTIATSRKLKASVLN